jgi:hypothetical protein
VLSAHEVADEIGLRTGQLYRLREARRCNVIGLAQSA